MKLNKNIAILGGGNLGISIAKGLLKSRLIEKDDLVITRRNLESLKFFSKKGVEVTKSNVDAVKKSEIIILAVQPQQLNQIAEDIKAIVSNKQMIISVISGAKIADLKKLFGEQVNIVRAMPNTAISIQESMTCISSDSDEALKVTKTIFDQLGSTMIIAEELMVPATALCACGIAFFLRAIRAASQGGIEIGFHAEEALLMAAQTAKGAAALLLAGEAHPESEVDKVTTPRGCTISGLNQMEHNGFSSAMIKGIVSSAEKAAVLYSGDK